jgi:hypothetical protein
MAWDPGADFQSQAAQTLPIHASHELISMARFAVRDFTIPLWRI